MAPLTNITITVPLGSAQYGDQLCLPASLTDVLTFYLSNYVVHLGSVQFYPGELTVDTSLALVVALLFPTAGVVRGVDRIARFAILGKDALSQAARAGALCMVVRSDDWTPRTTETYENVVYQCGVRGETDQDHKVDDTHSVNDLHDFEHIFAPSPSASPLGTAVSISYPDKGSSSFKRGTSHVYQAPWVQDGSTWWSYTGSEQGLDYSNERVVSGSVKLPTAYRLVIVPRDAIVDPVVSPDQGKVEGKMITSTYSAVSALSGIAQLLFSISTVYTASGPQVDRFGYAAYGLTVLQYTVMSLVNTIASLVTPAYACLHMVDSEILQEAKMRGGNFVGIVGRLKPDRSPADFTRFRRDGNIVNGTAAGTVVEACPQSSNTSASVKTNIPQSLSVSPEESPESLVFTPYSADSTRAGLISRCNDQNEEDATTGPTLYIPCHPQFARRQRWYCPNGHEVPSWSGRPTWMYCLPVLCYIFLGLVPLLPIGLLSHFRKAESTYAERVVTMLWPAMGIYLGVFIGPKLMPTSTRFTQTKWFRKFHAISWCLLYGAPAIAGFVEVGLMYIKFGTCMQLYTEGQS